MDKDVKFIIRLRDGVLARIVVLSSSPKKTFRHFVLYIYTKNKP